MIHACIDIGSNTTRLLVAECRDGKLQELATQRFFSGIGKAVRAHGCVPAGKVAETAEVVARQVRVASELGAEGVVVVATAGVRAASNGGDLADAVREAAEVELEVLSGEEEARLAFAGATKTLPTPVSGRLAVVDIGGGSTEVAIGTLEDGVSWWRSVAVGSGLLTDAHFRSDPPSDEELRAARREAERLLEGLDPPPADRAVAVGGTARSVRKLVGQELSSGTLARALLLLASTPADAIAGRFDVPVERAALLPGGAIILDEVLHHVGPRIAVGQGGLREGILLELEAGLRRPSAPVASSPDVVPALAPAMPSEP